MSRVKYPSQETIDQQIQQIISRSGLFDQIKDEEFQYDSDERYVKCTPVRERKSTIGLKLISSVAAVAAVVMMVAAIANYTPVQEFRQQPMNTVAQDDSTVIGQTESGKEDFSFRNADIEAFYESGTQNEMFWTYTGNDVEGTQQLKYGTFINKLVTAQYKKESISAVEYHAIALSRQLRDRAYELYNQYYGSSTDAVDTGITVNYVQSVSDALLENQNIITSTDMVQIDVNDIEKPDMRIEMTGYSYNVVTGQQLTLSDMFSNQEAAVEEIETYVMSAVRESKPEMDEERVRELVSQSIVDGQCFFYNGELRVILNDYSEQALSDRTITMFGTFSVPLNQLHYLNSDYQ